MVGTFRSLKNLPIRKFKFYSNKLMKIEAIAFSWFEKLEFLDMSDSKGIDVDDLSDAWYGMKNVPIKSLILKNFGNKGTATVDLARFFKYFKLDTLTELALDTASISGAFGWKFSESTKNLRNLSLTYNNLNQSQINKILHNIKNLKHLTCLKLNNQLPHESSTSVSVSIHIDLPPNLRELDFSQTLVWTSYGLHNLKLNFTQNNSLNLLRLSNNFIDGVESLFMEKPNLDLPIDIDLSQNRLVSLTFLDDSAVRGLRIRKLYLADNLLGKKMRENVYENHHHLEMLDLSSNGIKELTGKIFIHQTEMKVLRLMKNCLWLVNFEFTHMNDLRMLDLSENSLIQLNKETRDRIDRMRTISPHFSVNLRGNPLECSCSNLPFILWVHNNRPLLSNFEETSCVYNNSLVKFSNIEQLVRNPQLRLLHEPRVETLHQLVGCGHRYHRIVRVFCIVTDGT